MTVLPEATRGDSMTIHIRDAVDKNGAPFDFTGWTVKFSASRWASAWLSTEAPFATKTTTDGITVLGLGQADVVLSPADTAAAFNGTRAAAVLVHWDVEASRTGQGPHTLDSGTVTVRRDIS